MGKPKHVYISASSKEVALAIKGRLEAVGHEVVSTWHDRDFVRTADRTPEDLRDGAMTNVAQIADDADVLVLHTPDGLTPGGMFVEAGVAIGVEKPVILLNGIRADGTRRNNLLYHDLVTSVDDADLEQAVASLEMDDDEDDYFDDDDDDDDVFDEDDDFEDEDEDID